MPPRSIMYHFTPATCCIDREGEVHQKRKRKKGEKRGWGGVVQTRKAILYTRYWLLYNKFSSFLNLFDFVGMNKRPTTVVLEGKLLQERVLDRRVDTSTEQNSQEERISQFKIWESISSVSILK